MISVQTNFKIYSLKITESIIIFSVFALYINLTNPVFAQKTSVIDSLEKVMKTTKQDASRLKALKALAASLMKIQAFS